MDLTEGKDLQDTAGRNAKKEIRTYDFLGWVRVWSMNRVDPGPATDHGRLQRRPDEILQAHDLQGILLF